MTLHEKLIELRKAVPYAKQDATGYKYDYVSGTSLLGILRPKMDELGLLLIPAVTGKSWTETKDDKDKHLFVVELDMTMTWVDAETGDSLPVPFCAFGAQNDPSKAFGSALTYSERYFLLKFFNVPTDKLDPDAFQEKNKPKVKAATQTQEKAMFKMAKESGWSKEAAGQYLVDAKGIKNFSELDSNEVDALTDYFKRTPVEKSDGPTAKDSKGDISKDQVSKIWVEAREQKWDHDDIHQEIHTKFDKKSVTELTSSEASQLIDFIKQGPPIPF